MSKQEKKPMYFQLLVGQYEDLNCQRFEPGDIIGPTTHDLAKGFGIAKYRRLSDKEVAEHEAKTGIDRYMKPQKAESKSKRIKVVNIEP